MAVIAMVYIWLVYGLFRHLPNRTLLAWGIAVLLLIPLQFVINAVLSKNDIRAAHGHLGHSDHVYPADCGVHNLCL